MENETGRNNEPLHVPPVFWASRRGSWCPCLCRRTSRSCWRCSAYAQPVNPTARHTSKYKNAMQGSHECRICRCTNSAGSPRLYLRLKIWVLRGCLRGVIKNNISSMLLLIRFKRDKNSDKFEEADEKKKGRNYWFIELFAFQTTQL